MKSELSYAVELLKFKNIVKPTIRIYRKAVAFLIDVVEKEWESVSVIETTLERKSFVEKITHTTARHTAKYEFDIEFPKFPRYLFREAISEAIGAVSSYKSNYQNWLDNGKVGEPPKLTANTFRMPCFYNDRMYRSRVDDGYVLLKLFIDNDWRFIYVKVKKTDVDYIRKR